MANTLAEYDSAGCLTPFSNGSDGQVLQIVNGTPTWVTLAITCEDIQDCIGSGVGPAVANTGISYSDATNSFKFDTAQLPVATGTVSNIVVSTSNQASGATMTPAQLVTAMCSNILTCAGIPIQSGAGLPAATANAPIVWTDTATGNIYYRDPTGANVQLSSPASDIPISNITGTPPGIAGSPGVFTDTDTGTVYYRDNAGSVVVLDQTCCVSVQSGAGAPLAGTLNDATVWTDTATGNVYYRDKDGNVVQISSPSDIPISNITGTPTNVANSPGVFTDTDTGTVYYRDKAGSVVVLDQTCCVSVQSGAGAPLAGTLNDATVWTDTTTSNVYYRDKDGNVVLISTPIPITSGAGAPAATTNSPTIYTDTATGNIYYRDETGATVIIYRRPLPVANFEITSKIAMTAAFSGASSSGTEVGNTLTYAWTATPVNGTVGAAVIATPAAVNTSMTFPNDGEWQITLVVTDVNGNTDTVTKLISVARYLTVNGTVTEVNGSWFGSLQAAYNWINTNDAANAALYLIDVFGVTTDAARITPNQARVHFKGNGLINVGVDFGAGSFFWSSDNQNRTCINAAAGHGVTIAATTTLSMDRIYAVAGAASRGFSAGAGGVAQLTDCTFSAFVGGVQIGGTLNVRNCKFIGAANGFAMVNGVVDVDGIYVIGGVNFNAADFSGSTGAIKNANCVCPGSGNNAPRALRIFGPAAGSLLITDWYAECRGAITAGFHYPAFSVDGNGQNVIVTHGTAYSPNGTGMLLLNGALATQNIIVTHCTFIGAVSAITSSTSSTLSGAAPNAWNPARLFACVFQTNLIGPITPAAPVFLGGNQQF